MPAPGSSEGSALISRKYGHPGVAQPEVDAAQVAAIGEPEHGLRGRAGARRRCPAGADAGALHAHRLVLGGLQRVVVDGVAPLAGELGVDDVLHRGEHAVVVVLHRGQVRHRQVAPRDVLLHQDAGRVALQRPADLLLQLGHGLGHRVLGDALAASLEVGLHDDREAQRRGRELLELLHVLPARRPDVVVAEDQLGELLVQGDRERIGVAPGVGERPARRRAPG